MQVMTPVCRGGRLITMREFVDNGVPRGKVPSLLATNYAYR